MRNQDKEWDPGDGVIKQHNQEPREITISSTDLSKELHKSNHLI